MTKLKEDAVTSADLKRAHRTPVPHRTTVRGRSRRPGHGERRGLTVRVTSGVGSGPTSLAAVDRALGRAGVGSYNLTPVTSLIPAGSTVVAGGAHVPGGTWGDRLYAVTAGAEATRPGEEAWAGLGWAQDPITGRGLIANHVGSSQQEVRAGLETSLRAMVASRGEVYGPIEVCMAGTRFEGEPAAAVVVATFGSETWGER